MGMKVDANAARPATPNSDVPHHPVHSLVAPVAEIHHRRHQHELEIPRDGRPLLLGQDRAAVRALTLLAQILVLDEGVALLTPGHYWPPTTTCRRCVPAASSGWRRTRTSRAIPARCSGC